MRILRLAGETMKLVYGHTDSIYVQMPMEQTEDTLEILNNHVREKFPNLLGLDEHPVNLEFEKYYSSLGVGCTKNRNAGLITWKDGKYLDEEEFVMTGFTAKRMTITKLARDLQMEVLKMWVNGIPKDVMTLYLQTEYNEVLKGTDFDVDPMHWYKLLANRSRYRSERFKYKCASCGREYSMQEAIHQHKITTSYSFCSKCGEELDLVTLVGKRPSIGSGVEGVIWYNQHHDNKITDSYWYVRVRIPVDGLKYINPVTGESKLPTYISAPSLNDLLDEGYPIDFTHYAESIVKKAQPVYDAMGWDISAISKDTNQKTLDAWW